jgi:two-component sensor histidine kinase
VRTRPSEKDLLLQEMSHRVKNKFAMISSMIALQVRSTATSDTRTALEAIGSRVRVIARVHDYLQLARQDGTVDMKEYLEGLCGSLRESLQDLRPVSIQVFAVELALPPEKALSIGLMVNELVVNALKYAFPDDRAGVVNVRLEKRGGIVALSVADDGIGCEQQATGSGLGSQIVKLLAAQLSGEAHWTPADPGCTVTAEFPIA